MTREQVELVRRFFEPYGNQPGFGPALELVEHVTELQAFICELSDYYAACLVGATNAAQFHAMQRRCEALRQQIEPLKGEG
jgi:hypothetical protein